MTVEEKVLEKLRELPPQKQEEVLAFVSFLRERSEHKNRRTLHGLWADQKVKISESDVSNARHEMWGKFPRDIS